MRTIIAGSRSITDYAILLQAVEDCPWEITCVVSGAARGVDALGEKWAFQNNVPCERYPADWNRYGRRAGVLRNRQMAELADALLAVWDGQSAGTAHMIEVAAAKSLPSHVLTVPKEPESDAGTNDLFWDQEGRSEP